MAAVGVLAVVCGGVGAAASLITPAVELRSGPTSLSAAPRLPSLKAGFSTQAGCGFDSGHGGAARYTAVRPDVVSMVNGPGSGQVLMGGWSMMMMGDWCGEGGGDVVGRKGGRQSLEG